MPTNAPHPIPNEPRDPIIPAPPKATFTSNPNWRWVRYAVAAVVLVVVTRYFHVQDLSRLVLNWIETLGAWGPLIFIGIYVVATVLFIPGSVLTLGAGAMFGVVRGSIIVSISATLGATAAFLVGRYLARDLIERKIKKHTTFAIIDRAIGQHGWKIVLLTRLSPVFPFTFLNYAFGLTRVKLSHYVVASWFGMIPGALMYVYLGSLVSAGAHPRQRTRGEWVLYGIGLVATFLTTVLVTRLAKTALTNKTGAQTSA